MMVRAIAIAVALALLAQPACAQGAQGASGSPASAASAVSKTMQIGAGAPYGYGFYGFGNRTKSDIRRPQSSQGGGGLAVSAAPESWAMRIAALLGLSTALQNAHHNVIYAAA